LSGRPDIGRDSYPYTARSIRYDAIGTGINNLSGPASPATTLDTWSAWTALATAAQMTKGFVWHGVSMAMRVQPQFPDAGLPSPQFFWFTEWEVGYGGGAAPAAPATIAAGYAESGGAYNATTVDPVGPFFQAYNDHWWFPTPATLPAGQDVKMHASKSINNIGVGASPHASMLNSQYLLGFLENHLPADFDRRYDQMYRQKGLYVGRPRHIQGAGPGPRLTLVTPGGMNTFSPWVTVVDPCPTDVHAYGAVFARETFSVASPGFHFQFGIGPSGGAPTEIVLESWCAESTLTNVGWLEHIVPGTAYPGERLAIRAATFAGGNLFTYPLYCEAA